MGLPWPNGCDQTSSSADSTSGAQREAIRHYALAETLLEPRVWLLTLVYFGQNVSGCGFVLFLPQIVRGHSWAPLCCWYWVTTGDWNRRRGCRSASAVHSIRRGSWNWRADRMPLLYVLLY
jgi:hypothetical protein